MNKKIKELTEKRADQEKIMTDLLDLAETEKRDLNDEEVTAFEAAKDEIVKIDQQIEREKEVAEIRKRNAKPAGPKGGEEGEKKKIAKRYDIHKVIRSRLPGTEEKLEGVELEMHQEAIREARAAHITQQFEGVGIPSMLVRDMTAGTDTEGGHTIETELGGLVPFLHPKLITERMGATRLTGLVGDVKLPRGDGVTTATWEGENDANAESTPSFDDINLSPKRLGAKTHMSKQLLFQSSISVQDYTANLLNIAIAEAVDIAAINGSGVVPIPEGILNISGIGSVAIDPNGGAPTHDHLVDLESEITTANADMGRMGYVFTPGMLGKLKKTKVDAGSGVFVVPSGANQVNGYNFITSTLMPSNLTKGSGTDLHAAIFGNWAELIIGNWAGIDLVVDPYTQADTSRVRLIINSWWDVAVRHAASFAAIVDADIS